MKKRKQQNKFPVLYFALGGLLLLVTAVLLLTQGGADQAAPAPAASGQQEETYPEIARVSLPDARAALDANSAVFLDVRAADVFAISHIPGALNIPLAELETRLAELDPNKWIITYCT